VIAAQTLAVLGYEDRLVPTSFLRQPQESSHLAVLLPGYRHTVDRPDLHYAQRILLAAGADVLRVEYQYWRPKFESMSSAERDTCLAQDAKAAVEVGMDQRAYERLTLVGKSLGTVAMCHLLADVRFQSADCIWETPLLTEGRLCDRITQVRPRSLFIVGTADECFDRSVLTELELATGGRSVVIEGADHSLEVPESIPQSLVALGRIAAAIEEFVRG
jgi:predicted alpha/beta-hydrolase family hydrolase